MPPERNIRHVLIVIESDYPTFDGGGAETQVETLTRNLPPGLEATVIAPLVPNGPQSIDDNVHGVAVHRIAYPRLPLIGGMIMLVRLALLIIARRDEIDAIHCHIANNMAAVCAALGRLLNIPVVVKLTGMLELRHGILSDHPSLGVRLKRWLIQRANALQAISDELESGLIDKGFEKERVHLIPNAVDTHIFGPVLKREDQRDIKQRSDIDAEFVACFVGRLVPEKALDMLIRAWDQAIPMEAEAALVLVGTGLLEPDLKALVNEHEREHQVRFAGFIQNKAVIADYWRIADVGILTSDFEGLSNALLEAMASAVPMIGSRVSGNTDLILPGKTGWLFEPRNQDQLAACLGEAFAMDQQQRTALGEATRKRALETVGVDHIWGQLTKLYGHHQGNDMALCAE